MHGASPNLTPAPRVALLVQYVPRFVRPGARYPPAVLDALWLHPPPAPGNRQHGRASAAGAAEASVEETQRSTLTRLLDLPLPDSSSECGVVGASTSSPSPPLPQPRPTSPNLPQPLSPHRPHSIHPCPSPAQASCPFRSGSTRVPMIGCSPRPGLPQNVRPMPSWPQPSRPSAMVVGQGAVAVAMAMAMVAGVVAATKEAKGWTRAPGK